jgi:hypothetical protein
VIRPRPKRQAPPRKTTAVSLPAPIGGWNARDSLGDMPPSDAVSLVNWVPSTTSCDQRYGFTQHATGLVDNVETLMQYSGAASSKLFAAAGTSIFNVTNPGAVGAADVTGLSNSRWQYVNNTTSGGHYIQAVNGADKMEVYDGSAWHKDGDGVPYNVTGVNTANCTNISLFKNRVWFIEDDTLKAWYLPAGAIGGAAASLDLSSFASRGGYLVAMADWTIDAGYGVDDLAAFITSNGEVIVYRGTDPASASTWALVGVWWLGSPVGTRCAVKYGGDVALICQDGVVPLASALQSSRLDPRVALSNKIQKAISQAVSSYGANFGWQLIPFPKQNLLILNVPYNEQTGQQQFVMSTIQRSDGSYAWCNFQGWPAQCWELWQNEIYFGGPGYVGHAWNGLEDNGANIETNGLQAFNYFKRPGIQKRFTMMRPTISTNGIPSVLGQMNIQFDQSDPSAPLSFAPIPFGVWDTGLWDAALWGSDLVTVSNWQGATGVGYCAAPRLKTAAMGLQIQWVATDVVFEEGAIL